MRESFSESFRLLEGGGESLLVDGLGVSKSCLCILAGGERSRLFDMGDSFRLLDCGELSRLLEGGESLLVDGLGVSKSCLCLLAGGERLFLFDMGDSFRLLDGGDSLLLLGDSCLYRLDEGDWCLWDFIGGES